MISTSVLAHAVKLASSKAKLYRGIYIFIGLGLCLVPLVLKKWVIETDLIFLVFIMRSSQFMINHLCRNWIATGRRWHRAMLLHDSLGDVLNPGIIHEVHKDFPELKKIENYYASDEKQGSKRLIENITESAFFTSAYTQYYKNFILISLLAFILGIFFIVIKGKTLNFDEIKLLTALAGFFLFGDVANRYLELQSLERKTSDIKNEGLSLMVKSGNVTEKTSRELAFNYILVQGNSIPIPDWVHWIKRKKLDAAWKKANSSPTE